MHRREGSCMHSSDEKLRKANPAEPPMKNGAYPAEMKPNAGSASRKHRYLSRILEIGIILAVVACVEIAARACFDGVHLADYYNRDIRNLTEEKQKVKMVVLGASQVYHGCDTELLADKLGGGDVIAAGVASSTNVGNYYIMKDLLKRFDPEIVLIDLHWNTIKKQGDISYTRGNLLSMDRLPYLNQLEFAFKEFSLDQIPNVSAMFRFGGKLYSPQKLLKNYIRKKEVAGGKEKRVQHGNSVYIKNGFSAYVTSAGRGSMPAEHYVYSNEQNDAQELAWVKKTQKLCEDSGARVIYLTLPSSMSRVYSVENNSDFHDFVNSLAKKSGTVYLDMNLLKDREKTLPDTMFTDNLHLNVIGANFISGELAKLIQKTMSGEDVSGYFYSDFAQMQKDVHRIVACSAVSASLSDDGSSVTVQAYSLRNPDLEAQYRLLVSTDGKEYEELVPWQDSETLTGDAAGLRNPKFRLEVRQKGQEDYDAYQNNITVTDAAGVPAAEGTDAESEDSDQEFNS